MTDYQKTVEQSPDLAEARGMLGGFQSRATTLPLQFRHQLARLKAAAVAAGDATMAGAVWCLETIADAQDHYLSAWHAMREDRFYAAWCALERSEIALHFVARHLDDSGNTFGVALLRTYVARWQSLFPYRVFLSPGFSKRSIHCSVCDTRLTPRRQCAHHLGELYEGVMCHRVVKDATMIEISLVERPVQKYSVAWAEGQSFDYALVHYVVSGLVSPWHRWELRHSVRLHPDPTYLGIGRNTQCPCGSGKKFKKCHSDQASYECPHVDVAFLDEMAPGLPAYQFGVPHRGRDDGPGNTDPN